MYNKTAWTDGITLASAANTNKIEGQLESIRQRLYQQKLNQIN